MSNEILTSSEISKLKSISTLLGMSNTFARSFSDNILRSGRMTPKQRHVYISLCSQLAKMFKITGGEHMDSPEFMYNSTHSRNDW